MSQMRIPQVPAVIVAGLLGPIMAVVSAVLAPAAGAAIAQAHAQVQAQTPVQPGTPLAPGATGAGDPEDSAAMAVVERFLTAAGAGDVAGALELLADDVSYVGARPSNCTPLAPCTGLTAVQRDLTRDRADRAAPTIVSEVRAAGPAVSTVSTVSARLEERSWYRWAVGPDRTITVVTADVHDGKLTRYVGAPDLEDEQTRNFEAFHTGWTPALLARAARG
jgi:ketosteroid isomerase-like protein